MYYIAAVFGFPFKNMYIIIEKTISRHFFGIGNSKDLDGLQNLSESHNTKIIDIFVEAPSNLLSNTPNFLRIETLGSHFSIFIVVGNTIGNLSLKLLAYK